MTGQLTFDAALSRAEAERGMSAARSGLMEWRDKCELYLRQLRPGHRFTADDLTFLFGLPTDEDGSPSNNGIGALLHSLSRQKRIRCVGYTRSTRTSSHSRVLRVWEVVGW